MWLEWGGFSLVCVHGVNFPVGSECFYHLRMRLLKKTTLCMLSQTRKKLLVCLVNKNDIGF